MSIGNWIAIAVPILGLVGGAIVYQIQRSIDRSNQLRAERRDLYRKLVALFDDCIVEFHNKDVGASFASYREFRKIQAEILVCAPDAVVEKLKPVSTAIIAAGAELGGDSSVRKARIKSMEDVMDAAIHAMRGDVLGSSKISLEMIAEFSRGLAVSLGRFPR
ncbi:hypothetical protein [Celeribacter marinus]|uniref:hypothetical protein n=1 Tax=Celeribacter marinus TaxID=1397108 RepID=UPI000782C1BF|nr:hypothetical protein [Celeribacter marinus]SFK10310.1 hypothetical protein SAMN05444421_101440 [Celeribacter marinus]